MKTENLEIIIDLSSPVILTEPLHLDAILAYALYKETNDLHVAHEELPLKKTNGVYHASALRFVGDIATTNADFVNQLKGDAIKRDYFKPNSAKGTKYLYIDTNRGEHKSSLDKFVAAESVGQQVKFFACGDKEAITALLKSHIFSIGKKGNQGYGAIKEITVKKVDNDYSLEHPDCGVMRSLPVDSFNVKSAHESEFCASYPPYYQTKKQLCYVPSSSIISNDKEEVTDNYF